MAVVKNDNWIRRFDVTDPKKHKNGFTVYKVTSVVFPKSAPEASTRVVVWKRYNDFKKLYDKLKGYHKQCNISEDLPQPCKGKYFKRFEENVIKDRINFALDLLNFIGRHQVLFTSDPFLQFFNNSYHIKESVLPDSINENPEVVLNGNDLDNKGNLSSDKILDSKLQNEVSFECSDEDSNVTSDTPDSVSPIHSVHSIDLAQEKLKSCKNGNSNTLDSALDIVENPELLNYEIVELNKREISSEVEIGETVTCRSEKPMEVCVSVRTHDFRMKSESIIPPDLEENWITPPETPGGRQDYLVEAAYYVGQAREYEVNGNFEAAFCFYKAAVACLLSGVQDDEDKQRRQAVREKTNQYLQRAERIYALHLAPEKETGPKKITDAKEELKLYKVLRVMDSVMLVRNTSDNCHYVIKVLQKSPCPVDGKRKTVIPYSVPYMVKLIKYFENEDSIFLVLEYASGGKLWDHLSNYTLKKENENEFYSCSSNASQCDLYQDKNLNSNQIKDKASENTIPLIEVTNIQNLPVSREKEAKKNGMALENLDLDVMNLVENSQKLLHSVSKTLQNSDKLANNLDQELNDIETVLDLKCRLLAGDKSSAKLLEEKKMKKRSRSAVIRSKFEKSYSSENLSELRPRAASSSVDRRNEWMKMDSSPRIPESKIRQWGSELLVALETLHRWGIVCKDLHPDNILLSDQGHLLLTFQARWQGVDTLMSDLSISQFFAAPETTSVFPITAAADWWSFGALLHFLLTGKTLSCCYPEGIFSHTTLSFPDYLSPEVCSLLRELLRFDPGERLGSGINGAEDIKCHPFFSYLDWQTVYDSS